MLYLESESRCHAASWESLCSWWGIQGPYALPRRLQVVCVAQALICPRSQSLPFIFRTHSLQHSLYLQNSLQIPLEGGCPRKLVEVHWCWEEKALYCCTVLSSWPHISSLSKSELEALRVLSADLSYPLWPWFPQCFYMVDALWGPWAYKGLWITSLSVSTFIVRFSIYRAFHINCLNNECRTTRPRSLG